jgi:CDP-diacylglycerol--serine O-phosphatidyltransferase
MTDLFAPFNPEPEPPRRRFRPIPLRLLIPNLITLLALAAGLTAIRLSFEGRLELALVAIVVAAILDGLDGRIARLMKGTSRFGAELDSLSDFVNFGVAPGLILYGAVLSPLRSLGWIVALLFAVAAALRLARFNVMLDDPGRPEWKKNFFVGVPAPAGAICGLLPVFLLQVGVEPGRGFAILSLVYVLAIAFLMVSRIPTYAGKTLGARIPRERVLIVFLAVLLAVALLASFPFETLVVIVCLYLALIPSGMMRYRALERADQAAAGQPAPQEPPIV